MDPQVYQEVTDFLRSEGNAERKWPTFITGISDAEAKLQAKRNYRTFVSKFSLHMGTLVLSKDPTVRVITEPEKLTIMQGCHDGIGGAHGGITTTWRKIAARYWWKGFYADVDNYVKTCTCQAKKPLAKRPAELHPVAVPNRIFALLGMDLVGPLKETPRGMKYILVICDYLTKWPEAFPIPNKEALTVAEKVYEVICRQSVPESIISDQGREFCNQVIDDLCRRLGTKRRIATSYHPQSNGLTERFNQTLIGSLKKLVNDKQDDWDTHINTCLFAYRTSVQASTKTEPYRLVYGSSPFLPPDLDMKTELADFPKSVEEEELRLQQRIESLETIGFARNEAQQNIGNAQKKQKCQYDKKHRPPAYSVGQMITIENKRQRQRKGDKLFPPFSDPVKILEVNDNGTIRVEKRKTLVNVADIRPYLERTKVKVEPKSPMKDLTNSKTESTADVEEIPGVSTGFIAIRFDPVDSAWQKDRSTLLNLLFQWESYQNRSGEIVDPYQTPKAKGLICPDGNCFFRAISYVVTGSELGHYQIRKSLVDYIWSYADIFRPYTPDNHKSLEEHLAFMSESAVNANDTDRWGTKLEIFAAASMLNTTIWLFGNSQEKRNADGIVYKWLKFSPMQKVEPLFAPTDGLIFLSNEYDHFVPVFNI